MINYIFKKQSIFFTITITFVIAIILIVISFTVLYKIDKHREKHFSHKREMDVSRMVLREFRYRGISKDLIQNLRDMNFFIIINKKKQKSIFENKDLIVNKTFQIRMANIKYFNINSQTFIYISTPTYKILLENKNQTISNQYTLIAIFLLLLSIFILLYFITIHKLKPLKDLKEKMKNFASEQFDVDCATNKQDEISQLANEFDKTAKKLQNIKESRNIFIRNIMHELKTPITKGKILTQLPQTTQNNETMQKVFYRLESLISEFSTIEKLISTQKVLNKKEYYLSDIIDEAVDILMCDEDEILLDFKDIKINVDFQLFSIAIKNLLDNGIKYSTNKKIKVKTDGTQIIFENRGEKLKYPLKNYFEPFFKGDNVKSNQSFGLGLYIVKHISEANDYKIEYSYNNGINRFILEENKI